MSGSNSLSYIKDHWPQIYKWIREGFNNSIVNQGNIALFDDNVNNLVTNISFNPVTSQITFSYVDLNGNTISNTIDLSSLSQSPFQIVAIVDTFDDIAAAVPLPNLFEFVKVRNSQGVEWLPGSLGGTYYGAGLYYWTGTEWKNSNDNIFNGLQNLVNLTSSIQNQLNNTPTQDINSNYTIQLTDYNINVITSDVTITLLSLSLSDNRTFNISNSSGGDITIDTTSLENIYLPGGQFTSVILNDGESLTVQATTNYWRSL